MSQTGAVKDPSPLVLIHGSPATGQAWQPAAKHLGDRFRIETPTLPGHEGTGPAEEPAPGSTYDLAAGIEGAIGSISEPIVLAGHSYGASVALHVALRGHVDITRMVLFEPVTPHALVLAGATASQDSIKRGIGAYLEAYDRGEKDAVGHMIDFWFGAGAFRVLPEPVQSYLIDRTPVNIRDVRAALSESYTTDDLARLDFPILVAYGGNSSKVATDIAQSLVSGLPQGNVATIEGANHAMLASHPKAVASIIADFCG